MARFKYQYARALYAEGDFKDALTELNAASDAGHVRASYLLGRLYQFGAAVERDPAKAIPLFESGAKRGDPYSQYALGKALVAGLGTKLDIDRGMAMVASAAESGHTYAMNMLGTEYLSGAHVAKDEARALKFITESSDRNDVYGMVLLGILYRDGAGVQKDTKHAAELFEKARAMGHPYAGRLLARLAQRENTSDAATISTWYRESAERGDAWGAFYAAELLKDNPTLQKDSGEIARLYALSASFNFKDASDQAKKALGGVDALTVGKEVQLALKRAGQDVGEIDGRLGPRTREAANTVLGTAPPATLGNCWAIFCTRNGSTHDRVWTCWAHNGETLHAIAYHQSSYGDCTSAAGRLRLHDESRGTGSGSTRAASAGQESGSGEEGGGRGPGSATGRQEADRSGHSKQ
ncbi:SEL1-like repeat protein [Aminobacter anthyllidis]|nr:SEL1-like repeat protein [Aminobacter anthyllidis]MDH4984754.1 SEL1-like repeat protein [Aminobacter anthyllidis]